MSVSIGGIESGRPPRDGIPTMGELFDVAKTIAGAGP